MPKLRVVIFDVEHGFCAFVRSPNGYGILIDCGSGERFSPIKHIINHELDQVLRFAGQPMALMVVSHPHQDHLSDILNVISYLHPAILSRNQCYDWGSLKQTGGDYMLLDAYSQWQGRSVQSVVNWPDWGMDVAIELGLSPEQAYSINPSNYVNNSSSCAMFKYANHKFFFPGDLEEDGWKVALQEERFRQALSGTDFFVASHHGHSSGYCRDVYETMGRPLVNIVSAHSGDPSVESAYSTNQCATGASVRGQSRYMVSTRLDGSIVIEVSESGYWGIWTGSFPPNL